jgi:sulfate adenylyltransferase subunit 1 (EFTu-like GTPase family)
MKGDAIAIYPGGRLSAVEKITHNSREVNEAYAGQNITLSLTKGTEANRGDIISHSNDSPVRGTDFTAELCWLDQTRALTTGQEYILRMHSCETKCRISTIEYKINNDTYERYNSDGKVLVNEFASVKIEVKGVLVYDHFTSKHATGRGILIDMDTNNTSGAFVITSPGGY